MSKRSVSFTRPDEPTFLKRIKQQVGYKEGPTIDTKRETLDVATDEDLADNGDEQPTVVVLKAGDLTAEEAAREASIIEKKAEETPADLSAPIVFKRPTKAAKKEPEPKKSSKTKKDNKSLLSFDDEENDD